MTGDDLLDDDLAPFVETAPLALADGASGATDLRAALLLVDLYADRLRYVREAARYFVFDGRRFVADFGDLVLRLAQSLPRELYHRAEQSEDPDERRRLGRLAQHCESARTLNAITKLAQARPEIVANAADFDVDPYLFNVQNGTIDLRTGELRLHTPADMLTKLAPVDYEPDAAAPRWERFLEEIFESDVERIEFIQRAIGYALTGLTREQVLFVLFGSGANGKSSFIDACRMILGDYAVAAGSETFMNRDRKAESASSDVARLAGARFVSAIEVENGRRLAESFVKSATGGDTLTARFLFREPFEFVPAFKLFLACNHRPTIKGDDEGIWRRIRLVPFNARFEGEQRDLRLGEALAAEAPGILAWAVRGALQWQQHGLGLPKAVDQATRAYRSDQDVLASFIDDQCVTIAHAYASARALRDAYFAWAAANGERPMSAKLLAERLKERGLRQEHTRTGERWLGLGLRTDNRDGP